jgi:tRNA uridine 5-carboxymethylaminomethyl modification enzyme
VEKKRLFVEEELSRLGSTRANGMSLFQLLKRPDITYADLPSVPGVISEDVIDQVQICVKYSGYIDKQSIDVKRLTNLETKHIPSSLNYESISGLRTEARQKLSLIRPRTLGQAARISGVSPADVSLLAVWIQRVGMIRSDATNTL